MALTNKMCLFFYMFVYNVYLRKLIEQSLYIKVITFGFMRFITLIKRTYWLSPAQTHIDLAPIWPKHWNKWHSCSSGREGTHWYLKGCTRSSHVYGKFEWNNLALCWIEKVSYVSSITLFTSYSLLSSSCSLPLLIGYQLSYDAAQNHQIEISESKQWREGLMAWIDPGWYALLIGA